MRRFRFAYLLAALALVIFVRPFLDGIFGGGVFDVLLAITMVSSAYVVVDQKHVFWLVAVIGIVTAAGQVALYVTPGRTSGLLFLFPATIFYAVVTALMVRELFKEQKTVTRDTMCQAISVYLLLGLLGAVVYALLELLIPGSFDLGDQQTSGSGFDRFLGFSFTTLTTLGYGNIAPMTPKADALTTLQAVVGPIFLAIVIARLVAIQVAGERDGARRATGE